MSMGSATEQIARKQAEATISASLIVRSAWGSPASETPREAVEAIAELILVNGHELKQPRLKKVLEKTTAQEVADSEQPLELIASLYNSRLKNGRISTTRSR